MFDRREFLSGATLAMVATSARGSVTKPELPTSLSLDEEISRAHKGGKIVAPAGNIFLATGIRMTADRIALEGQGANVSMLVPAVNSGDAVKIGNDSIGGVVESGVRDLGFASPNEQVSAALHLDNVSTALIERIGIADGNWTGPQAIGIATSGRELITIQDCTIACSRPLVHRKNARHPTLALDHARIQRSLLFATGPAFACIECEDGVNISTSCYQNLALCGGKDGFLWRDRSSTIASFGLVFRDIRVEQGRTGDGWSINIDTKAGLQSLLMENCRLDRRRNGIRLRNVQRITLINVELDTAFEDPACLLDIVGVPGTMLIMINCFGQQNGRINLKSLKRVTGLNPATDENTIGGFEIWAYAKSA